MADQILIVVSRFNEFVTKALLSGAHDALAESGVSPNAQHTIWVPGAFEIPVIAATAARSGKYKAVICLGAVIRGETAHFEYVSGPTASGLMQVSIDTGVPIIFGVLTTDTTEQALARCGIKGGNKGREAAVSAIQMIKAMRDIGERTH